jgi:hypothetical protein
MHLNMLGYAGPWFSLDTELETHNRGLGNLQEATYTILIL